MICIDPRRLTRPLALVILAATLPACTAAAVGVAASAAQSGVAIIKKGRVTTVVLAHDADVRAAVERARDTLALDTRRVIEHGTRISYYFAEPDGKNMAVHVAPRSPTVTSLIIDVGSFGRADVARLMYLQTMDELADAHAFLEQWDPGTLPGASE